MQELLLINNKIGNPGIAALADAVGKGALPQLQELYLGGNSIGDVSLSALADVVSRGALDNIQSINLFGNPGNSAPVDNALKQRKK